MRTSYQLFLGFGVLVALMGPSAVQAVSRPIVRGDVVVSGNTLTTNDTLRPVNGKIYLDDVQVWPAVDPGRSPSPREKATS